MSNLLKKKLKGVSFQDTRQDFETECTRTPEDDLEDLLQELESKGSDNGILEDDIEQNRPWTMTVFIRLREFFKSSF